MCCLGWETNTEEALRSQEEVQSENKTHFHSFPTGMANIDGFNSTPLNKCYHFSCWQRFIFPWIFWILWKMLR